MYSFRCHDCKYYTWEAILPCAVDPMTATNSPREGCRDWEAAPQPPQPPQPRRLYVHWLNIVLVFFAFCGGSCLIFFHHQVQLSPLGSEDTYELSPPSSVIHIRED